MMFKSAVIFAAGKAKRMNGVSKAMQIVAEKPLISYGIDALLYCHITNIWIVHRPGDDLIFRIKELYKDCADIKFVCDFQMKGAVNVHLFIEKLIDYPAITLDCDIIVQPKDFFNMIKYGEKKLSCKSCNAVVAIINNPINGELRQFYVEDETIKRFCAAGIKNGVCGGYIFGWKYSLKHELLHYYNDKTKMFNSFFEYYISKYKVCVMPIEYLWDVDTLEMIRWTERVLENGEL